MNDKTDNELFSQEIADSFSKFFLKIRNTYKDILDAAPYTKPQTEVMKYLKKNGKSKMSDIGKELGVTKPYITALADQLSGTGLIYRDRDPKDRRIILLGLTEQGEEVFKKFRQRFKQNIENRLEKLSEDEKSNLKNLVNLMGQILSTEFFN